LLYKIFINLD